MATVTRFEDLAVWRKAKDLANAVYALCRQPPLASDFGLRGQMQRAAVSVMSNIAEGFERETEVPKTAKRAKTASQKPKKLSPPDEPFDLLPISSVGNLVWPPIPSDPFDL